LHFLAREVLFQPRDWLRVQLLYFLVAEALFLSQFLPLPLRLQLLLRNVLLLPHFRFIFQLSHLLASKVLLLHQL
jgi:hypothetical protein